MGEIWRLSSWTFAVLEKVDSSHSFIVSTSGPLGKIALTYPRGGHFTGVIDSLFNVLYP